MRNVRKRTRKPLRRHGNKLLIWLSIALLFAGVLLYIVFNTKYWNGEDKLAVVKAGGGGNVSVVVYDPKLEEIVSLVIPGDTEVTLARGLGVMRLKNVWQLGINEKLGGDLLAKTIAKNFLFPVFLWMGPGGETNIPIGDRMRLKLFEIGLNKRGGSEINLGEAQYLKKTKLTDGEAGFKLQGQLSERLTAYFSDNYFAGKNPKVYIKDATGFFGSSENVGKIIEVMGGKVVTIEKLSPEKTNCVVSGHDKKMVGKITNLFSCVKTTGNTGFDLEIRLGSDFLF